MPTISECIDVNVGIDRLWFLLKDKVRRPDKYVPGVTSVQVLTDLGPVGIERLMVTNLDGHEHVSHELIGVDEMTKTVIFRFKDEPEGRGYILNTVFPSDAGSILEYTMSWHPLDRATTTEDQDVLTSRAVLKAAVAEMKEAAEAKQSRPEAWNVNDPVLEAGLESFPASDPPAWSVYPDKERTES